MDELQKWFLENGSGSDADASMKKLLEDFGSDDYALSSEGYDRFMNTVNAERDMTARRRVSRIVEHTVAALLLLVSVVSLALLMRKKEPVAWNEVYTLSGQTRNVSLPDGSTLRLAPQSRLVYPSSFEGGVRKVFLQGEAYADITHNEKVPFEICSEDVTVTVLGTEFNFSSYLSDSECELALVDGSVEMRIDSPASGHTIRMKTGDMVRYDRSSGSVERQRFSADSYLQNVKRDGIQFTNRRMEDIVRALERRFGTQIVIEDEAIKQERFYASFINGEDLLSILSSLNTQNYMKIRRKGDIIYLSLK